MLRFRRQVAGVVGCVAALVLTACNPTTAGTERDPAGAPEPGGAANVIDIVEPYSLDPTVMSNTWSWQAFLGNALYGTLLINDSKTGQIQYKMAENFSTTDGGATFELKLRPGLKFTDGSPLDAAAVKFNWDRARDPSLAASNRQVVKMIASTTVVNAATLKLTMAEPMPRFPWAVLDSSMNWIASPNALKAGRQAFDASPVGAGPYILQRWTRQDKMELVRNPNYWDAPKPYLDHITLRASSDPVQRLNTLLSGGADVIVDTNWETLAKAKDAGLVVDTVPFSGGLMIVMNTRRPPFDDVRARQAVAAAVDPDAMNVAVYNGKAKTVDTLFDQSSPFYSPDLKLPRQDRATAQRIFDELAAEGKPVSFTFTATATSETKGLAESVQAQLSSFRNVNVQVKVLDHTVYSSLYTNPDFDMVVYSAQFTDPDPDLYFAFHTGSSTNLGGFSDPELDAALETGRKSTSTEERKAAYRTVQERLIALSPVIFTSRAAPSVVAAKNVYGVKQYGWGSLLPEELWIKK